MVLHGFSWLRGDEYQQAAHLLTKRVALLLDENNPRMRLALREHLSMEPIEVGYIARAEYPPLRRSIR